MTARTKLAKVVNIPTEDQFLEAASRGISRNLPGHLGDHGHSGVELPQHPDTSPGSQNNTQMLPKEV